MVAAHTKAIYIPTPCADIKFLLSHGELNELVCMLDATENELRALQLMSLFNALDNT